MLKIKLKCRGKKHQRTYDIIATNNLRKRDGKFSLYVGFYFAHLNKVLLNMNNLKLALNYGAYPTNAVYHLLQKTINCLPEFK